MCSAACAPRRLTGLLHPKAGDALPPTGPSWPHSRCCGLHGVDLTHPWPWCILHYAVSSCMRRYVATVCCTLRECMQATRSVLGRVGDGADRRGARRGRAAAAGPTPSGRPRRPAAEPLQQRPGARRGVAAAKPAGRRDRARADDALGAEPRPLARAAPRPAVMPQHIAAGHCCACARAIQASTGNVCALQTAAPRVTARCARRHATGGPACHLTGTLTCDGLLAERLRQICLPRQCWVRRDELLGLRPGNLHRKCGFYGMRSGPVTANTAGEM